MVDLITPVVFILTALVAATALVLAAGVTLHWGKDRETGLLPYAFYGVVITAAIGVGLSGRNLYLPDDFVANVVEKHGLTIWANRFTSMFLLLASFERIGTRLISRGSRQAVPHALLLAFYGLYSTNVLASALFAAHPSFSHDYLYPLIAGSAALLCTQYEATTSMKVIRNVLLAFLVVSFLIVPFRPELVLSRDYDGFLPGIRVRYAGLAPGPNTLGPLVAVLMLCLWNTPFRPRPLNIFSWVIALSSFLFSQSKSSWVGLSLGVAILCIYRYGHNFKDQWKRVHSWALICFIYLIIIFATAIFVAIMFTDLGDYFESFFMTRAGSNLLTMTGREQIWDIALAEWRANPVFGYGLSLWDLAYRTKVGLPAAFHAHNQFYQALSTSGFIGALGLIIYMCVLFRYAINAASASKGTTLALFAFIATRAVSEVPFALTGFGTEQMMHMLLLILIAAYHSSLVNFSRDRTPRNTSVALNGANS